MLNIVAAKEKGKRLYYNSHWFITEAHKKVTHEGKHLPGLEF